MQVKDIMTREVELVDTDTSIAYVAKKMRAHDIGIVPVCDGEILVGTITDRDITVRATANNLHPETIRSRQIMTPNVIYCYEDQDVEEARNIMQENKIRRLPVLDHSRRLVGMLSIGDIEVRHR